jgi:hypothetical protein
MRITASLALIDRCVAADCMAKLGKGRWLANRTLATALQPSLRKLRRFSMKSSFWKLGTDDLLVGIMLTSEGSVD